MKAPLAVLFAALLISGAFVQNANAELPPPPSVELAGADSGRAENGAIGHIDLVIGEAVLKDTEGHSWRADSGTPIKPGDVVRTGTDARLRFSLDTGDALHLGAATLVGLAGDGALQFWTGQAAIYAKTEDGGRTPLAVDTPDGRLQITGGKLGLSVAGNRSETMAFNNWDAWRDSDRYEAGDALRDWRVLARWQENGGKANGLAAGQRVASGQRGAIPEGEEVRFTLATSPEFPALKAALLATQTSDAAAKPLFQKLQRAFPGNAQAAYQLGRIALNAADNVEALRQWQLYSRLDPEGAEKLQIGPKMTLLIHQTLKDEIKQAIAAEAAISNSPPEPGSVAVLPFINRGDAAQAVLSKGLTAMVISDLSKVPGIKVLERAKLQKLIEEMQLSESGLVDEKTALRAGRLMKAEKIMLGDYQLQADKK